MFSLSSGNKKLIKSITAGLLAAVMLSRTVLLAAAEAPASIYETNIATKVGGTASDRLQKQMNLLVPFFSTDVNSLNAITLIEKDIGSGVFQGLKGWSYEGIRNGDKITLNWNIEWFDEHAALAAYKNPAVKGKLTQKQIALLNKCVSIISAVITPEMTDYEKELAFHDYIALNCAYDEELANSAVVTGEEDSFYAYGALIKGKAVCSGYTEAAKLLLDMVGIENYRLDSEGHSWNLVKIDGEYYHMDVTWDDPAPDVPGLVLYDYFNLTDSIISGYTDHGWINREYYPKADAEKYNYFVYNKLSAKNYEDLQRLLGDAAIAGKEQVTILVSDSLINESNWSEELKFLGSARFKEAGIAKYSYSPPNKNKNTLTVVFKR